MPRYVDSVLFHADYLFDSSTVGKANSGRQRRMSRPRVGRWKTRRIDGSSNSLRPTAKMDVSRQTWLLKYLTASAAIFRKAEFVLL
jgi:hypothetical protein